MRGGRKGLASPLRWHGTLLVCLWTVAFSWLLPIISQGLCYCYNRFWLTIPDQLLFAAIFANPGGFKLIIADQLAHVLANLSDSSWSLQINLLGCSELSPQPFLPFRSFIPFFSRYEGSGEYFSTDLVQHEGASWQLLARVVPTHGFLWIPPCLSLKCSGPLLTFKAPVSGLIHWWWV